MGWLYLFVAGLIEIAWAYGLKLSEGFTQPLPSALTVVGLTASFVLFAQAMRTIEIGTAYAVFTGIGTAGTVVIGIALLDEPVSWLRMLFVVVLIAGIIGLKMVSAEPAADNVDPEGGR